MSGASSEHDLGGNLVTTIPRDGHQAREHGARILAAAVELAAAGTRVFPTWGVRLVPGPAGDEIRCACGSVACPNRGKHPVGNLAPHGHNDGTTDLEVIRRWFQVPAGDGPWTAHNLGVTGGRGLVVIDADVKQVRPDWPTGLEVLDDWETWTAGTTLPPTKRVRTGGGGLHLWYRVHDQLRITSRNRVLPGVDVKADGGYVLAPPSLHESGRSYELLREDGFAREPVQVPDELLAWLLTVKGGRYVTRRAADGPVVQPDDYDFRVIVAGPGCPLGHRDYFVNDLCFRLRRAGVSMEDAAEALRHEWLRMERPAGDDFPWDTCLYKLRRVWAEVEPEDISDIPAWRPPGTTPPANGGATDAPGASGAPPVGGSGVPGAARTAVELLERPELTFHTTDTGNGIRFAQRMREVVRFCVGESRWYLWDGQRWAPDRLNRALHLTEEIVKDMYQDAAALRDQDRESLEGWARTTQSLPRRRAMLEVAASQPGIAINPDDLDRDPWLLVLRNGTLDLRTGQMRESRPDDLCTRLAEVDYEPEAEAPRWRAHVDFVSGGNASLAAWLSRAAGYTLTGLTGEQKVFFLQGTGQNGKSTFVDVIGSLLGTYAVAGDENLLTGTGGHPTQLADLRGARLVFCDETDRDKKLAEQRIKMMTGKKIKARFMRQDFFEYTPRFKVWISGNHKPEIRGNDDGIWRRLKLVPFTNRLTDDRRILDYDELLRGELPGILTWALAGLRDWIQLGSLGEPDVVVAATREYREEEDVVGAWVADACVEDYGAGLRDGWRERGAWGESSRLYASWSNWAHANGHDPRSSTWLGRELAVRGAERDLISAEGRKIRVRRGIWLRADGPGQSGSGGETAVTNRFRG